MTSQHLTLSALAKLLWVPMHRLRSTLDAGHRPPGVVSVELTPGGHRRVTYRPAPPVVFCGSRLLEPAHPLHASPWHRPWAKQVDDLKARRVRDLCRAAGAELIVLDTAQFNPRHFRAAFRQLDFTDVEVVPVVTNENNAAWVWLANERLAGWPRKSHNVTPELELSEGKDA